MFSTMTPEFDALGGGLETASWIITGLNVAGFLPIGIIWAMSGPNKPEENAVFRTGNKASMIYSWILVSIDFVYYIVFFFIILFGSIFTSHLRAEALATIGIGSLMQWVVQIVYGVTAKRAIMYLDYYDPPELDLF